MASYEEKIKNSNLDFKLNNKIENNRQLRNVRTNNELDNINISSSS